MSLVAAASSVISAKKRFGAAGRLHSARRRSERARDKEYPRHRARHPAIDGETPYLPMSLVDPPPSSIISAKKKCGTTSRLRSARRRSERARDKEYPRHRAQHPAIDRRDPVPADVARRPTARAPSFPLKRDSAQPADFVRRGAGRERARDKEYPRHRAQHPAIDRRDPVPADVARRPTARAPSFPLKRDSAPPADFVRRGAGRSEQGIKSIPATVRNTRRSIGETPYLPMSLVAHRPSSIISAKKRIRRRRQTSFGAAQVGASKG